MPIADGSYPARAVTAALAETSTGKEQIAVEFALQREEGGRITWYGFFTEKTTERTLESLRACGWMGTDLSDLSGIDANEVELVIEAEEYEGKVSPRVRWVNRPGGIALQSQMSADKAKAFAARMRGQVLAYDQKSGAGTPAPRNGQFKGPPPGNGAPPHTDSDKPPF